MSFGFPWGLLALGALVPVVVSALFLWRTAGFAARRSAPVPPHLALSLSLLLLSAGCATSRGYTPQGGARRSQPVPGHFPRSSVGSTSALPQASSAPPQARAPEVDEPTTIADRVQARADGRVRLLLPSPPSNSALDVLTLEETRPFLAAFAALSQPPRVRLHLLEVPAADSSGKGSAEPWESRLRDEFISRFGPPLLPLPESLATSRLFLALQLAPLYMHEGIRQAAIELFTSRAFVLSVCLSIIVYFSAWLAPEPIFTKAFAAALTLRLALVAGVLELGQLALACLRLHQEAEASSTPQELEAASRRFAQAMSGTYLRVLVTVATLGIARFIPSVPEGGIWRLLPVLTEDGAVLAQSVTRLQVVADGSVLVSGVAVGSATCSALAWCASNASGGGVPKLSTRYGPPHTRKNPPHNETIEDDLAAREAAGHADLRKNKAQRDAGGNRVVERNPAKGIRFRKPDASSIRPDGVRHNINYVSSPKDMQRELEAIDSMIRADPRAIHELYLLDGTLVKRFVPAGVSVP